MALMATTNGHSYGLGSHGLKQIYHKDNGDHEQHFVQSFESEKTSFEVDAGDLLYVTAHFSFHPFGATGLNVNSRISCRLGGRTLRGPTNNLTGVDRNHVTPASMSAVFLLEEKQFAEVYFGTDIKGKYGGDHAGIRNWSIDILHYSKA